MKELLLCTIKKDLNLLISFEITVGETTNDFGPMYGYQAGHIGSTNIENLNIFLTAIFTDAMPRSTVLYGLSNILPLNNILIRRTDTQETYIFTSGALEDAKPEWKMSEGILFTEKDVGKTITIEVNEV